MSAGVRPAAPLRLFFEIERDDNPRLYDDLSRFKKGQRRVNRLRFLAHEGLMAERGCRMTPERDDGAGIAVDFGPAADTNAVFDAMGSPKEEL